MTDRRQQPGSSDAERRRSNRRAFPRWTSAFEVRYGTGRESTEGKPLEIGEGGLSFVAEKSIPLETELNVQFRLACDAHDEKGWIKVKAIVRHSAGETLGVEFLNLLRADRLKIMDFTTAS